jgi:hypothetical protein
MTLKVTFLIFLPERRRIAIEVVIVIERNDLIVLVETIGGVVRGPAGNHRDSVARVGITEYVVR